LGHDAVLLHANYVRPFGQTNKTDAADAKAIWTAAQQPGMPVVAPKTESQQCVLSLHAIRQLRVKMRTMLVNQLRSMLFEFGVYFHSGLRTGLRRPHVNRPETCKKWMGSRWPPATKELSPHERPPVVAAAARREKRSRAPCFGDAIRVA
jgi:transposase